MSTFIMDHIRFGWARFPVTGAYGFAQPIGQQGFSADHFKTSAAALPDQQFHQAINALCVASRVPVREVSKNRVSVLLNRHGKGPEHLSNIGSDLVQPGEIALKGFFYDCEAICWSKNHAAIPRDFTNIQTLNGDPYALAPYGQIHEALKLFLVFMELRMLAEDTVSWRREALHLDVNIVFILVYLQNTKGWKSQQVQELLSLKKELPHKFSVRAIFPVASDRRLLRAVYHHPTRFYDCEAICWSKNHAAIPRDFTNIRFLAHCTIAKIAGRLYDDTQ